MVKQCAGHSSVWASSATPANQPHKFLVVDVVVVVDVVAVVVALAVVVVVVVASVAVVVAVVFGVLCFCSPPVRLGVA